MNRRVQNIIRSELTAIGAAPVPMATHGDRIVSKIEMMRISDIIEPFVKQVARDMGGDQIRSGRPMARYGDGYVFVGLPITSVGNEKFFIFYPSPRISQLLKKMAARVSDVGFKNPVRAVPVLYAYGPAKFAIGVNLFED